MLTKPNTPKTKYALLVALTVFFTCLLTLKPSQVKAQVLLSDSLALVDLYNSADGPNWVNNGNWNVTAVPFWDGITVVGNRVSEINFPSNSMTGTLPASIGDLTGLTVLDLSSNFLSGSIPVEIGTLTLMTTLNLGGNQLTGSLPTEIGNLTALVDFQLWANQLSGPLPTSIGNLTNLTYLDLAPNEFSGTIPTEIGNLVNLGTLWLNNNQFVGAVPGSFVNLTLLTNLYLQGNLLTDLPDLSSLSGLTVFNIAQNYFEFDDLEPNAGVVGVSYSPQNLLTGLPTEIDLNIGDPLTLTRVVAGTGNLYQWTKDFNAIAGATASTFNVASVGISDAGSYRLQATNAAVPGLTLESPDILVNIVSPSYSSDLGYQFYKKLGAESLNIFQYSPQRIGVDDSDNIYTTDSYSSRIYKINSLTGDTLFSIAHAADGIPVGNDLEFDGSGNLYVTDETTSKIVKYDNLGNFVFEIPNTDGTYGMAVDTNDDVLFLPRTTQPFTIQKHSGVDGQFIETIELIDEPNGDASIYLDVELDGAGNIYVIEPNLGRIDKFSPTGDFLLSFDLSTFWTALHFGVASNNHLYVPVTTGQVLHFDDLGTPLAPFGTGLLSYSLSIAESSEGLVVSDANNGLQLFDLTGGFIRTIGPQKNANGQFNQVSQTAIDSKGNRYVADYFNGRVQKFDSDGNFLLNIGSKGTGPTQLQFPSSVDVDNNDNLYVADLGNNRVQKYSTSGTHLLTIGSVGTADGQFTKPNKVVVTYNDLLYVLDAGNFRVQKFTTGGSHLQTFGSQGAGPGQFSGSVAMTFERSGTLLIADGYPIKFIRFDQNGQLIEEVVSNYTNITGLSTDDHGAIYVAGQPSNNNSPIFKLDTDFSLIGYIGEYGLLDGQFQGSPVSVSSNAVGDTLWISSSYNKISIMANPNPEPLDPEFPGLKAATLSENSILLDWGGYAFANGGDIYVERATSEGGPFLVTGILNDSIASYLNEGLFANTRYYFRLKHVKGLTESAYSNVIVSSTFSFGLPDTWQIQQALTTPGRLTLLDMAVDDLGNTYLAGNFAGTLFLNGDSIYSNGANDAIVIKVNSAKTIDWIKTFGSPAVDLAIDVALGPGGSVYVGGYYNDAFVVDSQTVTEVSPGVRDGFVMQLSADGTTNWITNINAPEETSVNKIGVDAAGNAYLAGYYNGDFTFGATTFSGGGGGPALYKVGPDGSKIFARFGTLVGNTRFVNTFNSVAVSGSNVYVTGQVDGQWSFEGTPITPNALRDAVLVNYGTDGSLKWVKTMAGPGEDFGNEVVVDAAGNVFWTGDFDGATATVDAVSVTNSGTGYDIYLAKVNGSNGTVLWGKSAGTPNENDTPYSLTTDGSSAFIAGTMGYGATRFDTKTLSNGKLFLASYGADGQVRWVDKSEGTFGLPWGLAYSKLDGGLLVTGSFEYTQRFGVADLIDQGNRNGFLVFHNDSDLPIASSIDSADLAIIMKLYDTTGGDAWTNKTNWKSALPVGFWHGIKTSNGRVVEIDLPGNNLIGELPAELFAMDSLRILNLGANQLTGTIPSSITGMKRLEMLYLNDNQIGGEIPADIGLLQSLNALDLGRNQLIGGLPESIGNLTKLESIFGVMGNQLEGIIPPTIGNLNKLKILALDANQFEGSIPSEIGNMAALEALYLHQNNLTGPLPDSIVNLKKLKSVYLSNNQLEGSVPAGVAAMDSLQTLIIQQNQFTFVPNLTGLTKLDTLNISNNKVGFGSIEPNLGVNGFVYSPQGRFGLPVDTLHSAGDAFLFELEIGGSTNSYQWFKDDVEITGATEQDYFIASAGETDEGIYFARVANASVPDLILDTDEYVFKISSRKRDSLALVAIYEGTGGPNWVNKTNWLNGDISTWGGITFENGRVRQIVLPNNRIVGPMPAAIRDIGELALIDFSNSGSTFDANVDNQIRFLPDLKRLNSLTSVNMTRNRLGFVSIETNLAALGDKFLFSPQRRFGETRYDSVPVGQAHKVAIEVSGLTNSYQWYFNDQPIEGATKRFHIIDNVNYDKMGSYFVEVKSPKVPDFSIRNRNQNVLATTTISGSINSAFDQSPLTSGVAIVYKIKEGPYDSIAAAQVSPEGAFIAEKIVLGDYIIIAKPDLELFPDALQTYYSSTIDWIQADTLRVRNPVAGLAISLLGTPPPLNGDGVIGGSLESDLPDNTIPDEEARILDRKRVAGAGVSLSRQRFRAKGNEFDYDFVAYTVTDEEGNFSFGTLTDDTYLINIQYPGVPMDQSSDILLTLGTQTDFNEISVAALVTPEGIVVDKVSVKGVTAPFLRDLNVYPNPGDDIVNLDYFVRRKVESLNMRVTDVTGRELMLQALPYSQGPQRTAMDISGLTPGMYILVISDEAGSFTETWRIQKR